MSQIRCVIQADSHADERRTELGRRLTEHHANHYPGETTTITWMAIPPGHMFTEGQPSTSSIISCFLDHPTTLDGRATYMRDVCDLWTETTGCTDHEVVVTITEP